MPHLTNETSVLETCMIETTSNALLTSSISTVQTEDNPAMLQNPFTPSLVGDDSYVCIQSTDVHWCTRLPLKVQSTDTASPLAVDALIDSGAMGQFIDAEFVKGKDSKPDPSLMLYLFITLMAPRMKLIPSRRKLTLSAPLIITLSILTLQSQAWDDLL